MIKLKNPFVIHSVEEYNCFGCSPRNELGLRLEFWDAGSHLLALWDPQSWMMGYHNILHGGIQATLMDEIAGWVVLVKCKTGGVTTEMHTRYLKPVLITRGKVEVKACLKSFQDNIAVVSCELADGQGDVCATAEIRYFCYPEPVARRKLHYPGIEAFYEV